MTQKELLKLSKETKNLTIAEFIEVVGVLQIVEQSGGDIKKAKKLLKIK